MVGSQNMILQASKSILNKLNIGLGCSLLLILVFGTGKNNLEIIFCVACFATIINLFFNQPIIFFTLAYHAFQATIKVAYAELTQVSLNELTLYSPNASLAEALRLSCIGIIALSCSIRILLPKHIPSNYLNFNVNKLFILYGGFVLVEIITNSVGQLGAFYQILYKLSILKWSILFLIIYTGIQRKKNFYFISIIGFEVLISVLSYFSTFKSVLFIALISFLILSFYYFKIKGRYFIIIGTLSLILLFTWQNIKEDYRIFLSGGERNQIVTVDFSDAYDKVIDLVKEKSYDAQSTFDKTVNRVSYIDFFAESINYIPSIKPHTNGEVWTESILHILQPRLFFPNKGVIDDSHKTMAFTGLMLADAEQGTSISLGYIAESYVDFGEYIFVIPVILLGLLIGWLFRKLFDSKINSIYCWAFAVPFYFQFYGLEMASEKILGSIITYAIIVWLTIKFGKKQFAWLEK